MTHDPLNNPRETFSRNRQSEFSSVKTLIPLIGHQPGDWPFVILKELMDNALDACEGVGTAPSISITLSDSQIIVSDNGPGMPRDTVKNLCDFSNRTSSNAAYISPARGAQGNALQTILAMARVQSDEPGVTIIEAHDIAHTITFDVDLVSDVPEIDHRLTKSDVHSGTPITVELASSLTPDEYVRFVQMARAYTWANPHLTLAFKSDLESFTIEASNLGWTKWTPADLTSALWYNVEQLKTLAASCVEKDRRDGHVPRHVSQFITDEFMGFKRSDSRAPVLDGCDGHHQTLETFLRKKLLGNLLSAAQKASKTYNAKSFGIIGKSHLQAKFSASVGTDTRFNHKLSSDLVVDGKPYLIEVAFGYAKAQPEERQIITCVNWSIGLDNQFPDLGEHLEELKAGEDEPITLFVHVAAPGAAYFNLGKSEVVLPDEVQEALFDAVTGVLKDWTKQRKAEDKHSSARANRNSKMMKIDKPMNLVEATELLMRDAYAKVSKGGELYATARQLYYGCRDGLMKLTKRDPSEVTSDYFTQTLLQRFLKDNSEEIKDWLVAYDDRGHFSEPHTHREIGLGTIAVLNYIGGYHEPKLIEAGFRDAKVLTHGPAGRYSAILFIEKEGFNPLFEQVKLAERYDLAIMSAKGMSVVAARELADQTCVRYGIPLLVLHDFDVNGFTIAGTISHTTERYTFRTQPVTHILGLRLEDVERYDLAPESFSLGKSDPDKVKDTMRRHGATEEEIEFIVDGLERVELNGLTSPQMIEMIERKLKELGIKKLVPQTADLTEAWRLFERGERIKGVVEEAIKGMGEETPVEPPKGLLKAVKAYLKANPAAPWDEAVAAIAKADK